MERLQKYMSRHGIASRRSCEEIIAAGKVKVNGKTVTSPGVTVDPSRDRVEVDGRILALPEKKVYIILHKPRGYISTVSDPGGRKKVTDLLDGIKERIYPVGRLDSDSEGLLILTNDGDLTFSLTHPGHKVPKTYRVRVKGIPGQRDLEKLSQGIMLEEGVTAPAEVSVIDIRNGNALLELTIHEGRNRQIKRMIEKIGHEVIRLKRIKIGGLSLGDLKPGQFRHLRDSEVRRLKNLSGMKMNPRPGR
jgi:pseudouridine synthase